MQKIINWYFKVYSYLENNKFLTLFPQVGYHYEGIYRNRKKLLPNLFSHQINTSAEKSDANHAISRHNPHGIIPGSESGNKSVPNPHDRIRNNKP